MTTIKIQRSESLQKTDQWDWPLNKDDGAVKLVNTADKFEVALDAVYFDAKEIEVKVNGEQLLIRCLHESQNEQCGEIRREINRAYRLPSDVDVKTLKSNLTGRGQLIITADKKK